MTNKQLNEIEQRLLAIPQGKYKADHKFQMFIGTAHAIVGSGCYDGLVIGRDHNKRVYEMTEFFANAPIDIQMCIKEIRKLKEKIKKMKEELKSCLPSEH